MLWEYPQCLSGPRVLAHVKRNTIIYLTEISSSSCPFGPAARASCYSNLCGPDAMDCSFGKGAGWWWWCCLAIICSLLLWQGPTVPVRRPEDICCSLPSPMCKDMGCIQRDGQRAWPVVCCLSVGHWDGLGAITWDPAPQFWGWWASPLYRGQMRTT